MRKTVGKKFGRALHYDFHTSPGIENIFGNFDADKFADQLKDAHVDYINMAARCNMGFSYYNTKVGKKYPGLGDRDPLAEIIEACHKKDIGVTAYFNVGLDHEIAADNYGWLKIDKEGRVYSGSKKNNFFRVMCYNTPYRQHFLEEIREVCQYDIDGIFCDCFVLRPCYCPACIEDMEKRGVDINDDDAVLNYQLDVKFEFADEMKKAMGPKADKIKFFINGIPWISGHDTHAEIECLPSDALWGYDTFPGLAAYTRTLYEDRVYMTGRFQNSWGDFGGVKPIASMQNDLYDSMMNSFAISYGDHMHPVDGFENEVAKRVKTVMEERIPYEPHIENSENVIEAGILIHSTRRGSPLTTSSKGAVRMLKELNIQFNIFDENSDYSEAKILIFEKDEMESFDESFKKRLSDYVKNGGKIIFTGAANDIGKECGLLDFIDIVEKDNRDNAYFTHEGSDMRWSMYCPSRIIKNTNGKETAKYVDNHVNFIFDGRQSYFYRPQKNVTEYSAAVIGENTASVCFEILKAYGENSYVEHRDLIKEIIDALVPQKLIDAPLIPKTATTAITKNDSSTVFHIKATYPEIKLGRGIIEEHTYMKSCPVSLLGEYDKIYKLPEMTEIESKKENGRTIFETGDILGYRAFLLK